MEHFNWNNLLSDNQDGFRPARSTAVMTPRIKETVEIQCPRYIKGLWQGEALRVLHKLFSYGISRRSLSISKSFLTSRSPKVVVNGQSSEILFKSRLNHYVFCISHEILLPSLLTRQHLILYFKYLLHLEVGKH